MKTKDKTFTDYTSDRQINRDIHDHEIFLAFRNDVDALYFSEWLEREGMMLFQKFLDNPLQ